MSAAARAFAIVALALASAPGVAAAQSKKECADAYVSAQVERKEGKLLDAKKKFEVCNAPSCPAALRRDCGPWLEQVTKDIPTLAVKVEGSVGVTAGARVTVDGAPFDAAKPMDPGEHVVRVEALGVKPVEQRVRLAEGEGRREIAIKLDEPTVAISKVPVAPIALGAAGLVGLGVFIGVGAAGNAKKADLDALGCKPNCLRSAVTSIKTHYIAADVALGLGLASLAAGGVLLGLHLAAPKQAAAIAPYVGANGVTLRF